MENCESRLTCPDCAQQVQIYGKATYFYQAHDRRRATPDKRGLLYERCPMSDNPVQLQKTA